MAPQVVPTCEGCLAVGNLAQELFVVAMYGLDVSTKMLWASKRKLACTATSADRQWILTHVNTMSRLANAFETDDRLVCFG